MIMSPVALSIREAVLKKQACFSQLTEDEVGALAELLVEKSFAPGETIVNEGAPVDSFYLLVEGTAEVIKVNYEQNPPQSKVIALLSAEKGDAIGLNETGFYSLTGLRTASVVAKTNVLTLFLTIPVFHGFSLAFSHVNEVMRGQSTHFLFKK